METPMIGVDDMYEFVAKKLISATTVSELTIFIEKLLTFKQLQYDLLTLLDHYYQVGNNYNKYNNNINIKDRINVDIFGDSQGESESTDMEEDEEEALNRNNNNNNNNDNNFSSSTQILSNDHSTTTETITKTCIFIEEEENTHSIIRSLYLSLAPINCILSTDLCTKIISYIPGREYFVNISLINKYFNYLVFYDSNALIYNESLYNISILDNIDLYNKYKYLLLIINFNNNLIEFIPPNSTNIESNNKNNNIYIKKIYSITDIKEIPYYGIKEWTLSILKEDTIINKKPKQLSLTNKTFENQMQLLLKNRNDNNDNENENKNNNDLIVKILENSIDGIYKLSLISCDDINRINKYPQFNKCIILCIDKCIFLNNININLSLTNYRFPNLQYLELINISFHQNTHNSYNNNNIFNKLIKNDIIYQKYNDNNHKNSNDKYDKLIYKILKVYRIIANNFEEWKIINDILTNISQMRLLSFKCIMKESGFIPMVRLLIKCVQQRNDMSNNNENIPNININKLKTELLNTLNITLNIPSTIEWLYLSNIDCKINLNKCKKLMGVQLNQIRLKQIMFPKLCVIPCFGLSINQRQIFQNWMISRPPVRFMFFNGKLKPKLNNNNSNVNNILNIISILKERNQRNTNRNKTYLSIYLNENDRKHLFAKLITFSLNFDINQMNQKIQIYKVWWNDHNVAKWIKDFGQNVNHS